MKTLEPHPTSLRHKSERNPSNFVLFLVEDPKYVLTRCLPNLGFLPNQTGFRFLSAFPPGSQRPVLKHSHATGGITGDIKMVSLPPFSPKP